ncbi:MAG: carboxypeptidase-like regulatory domain-containing protein, partial [Acidobacteriota bacterium]
LLCKLASLSLLALLAPQGPTPGYMRIEGAVYVRQGAGRPVHVWGATVEIYRTDVKRRWEARSDSTGIYVKHGLPRYGRYLVILSGSGIKPAFVANIEPSSDIAIVNIYTEPGDGSRLSLEEVLRILSRERPVAGPTAPRPVPAIIELNEEKLSSALGRLKAKGNQSALVEALAEARLNYERGIESLKAGEYETALALFEQAASFDSSADAELAELTVKAHALVAETLFLTGSVNLAAKNFSLARPHLEQSFQRITQAINLASSENSATDDLLMFYGILGKSARLLVAFFGEVREVDTAVRLLERAAALDEQTRSRWLSIIGDINSGAARISEAVVAYKRSLAANSQNADALYNLSMILLSSEERNALQQAANLLSDFLSVAPDDDRATGARLAIELLERQHRVTPQALAKRR